MSTRAAQTGVYRSRDAYVGGVCAGIAHRFDFDPIVIRILAIMLTMLTLGLGGFVYLLLWATLPKEPDPQAPYEVTPESAESSAYGCVDCLTGKTAGEGCEPEHGKVSLVARLAVAVCLMLLFLVVATSASPMVPGTEWWQFWPLGLLIAGLCLIIIPVRSQLEAAWHALGIVITSLSATLLPMSLGVMSWNTIPCAFSQAWPLILGAVAVFALGVYRKSSALVVGAAILVVLFCVVALVACAIPGELDELFLHMPDGRALRITFIR